MNNILSENKQKTVAALFTAIILTIWSGSLLPSSIAYTVTMLVGSFFFIGIVLLTKKTKYSVSDINNINIPILICIELIAICFLIASIRFQMLGYCAIACVIGFVFPFFYCSVNISRENNRLFLQALWDGTLVSYVFFLIISFLITPITDDVYAAFLKNPNTLGSYLIVVFIAAVYKVNNRIHNGKCNGTIKYSLILGSIVLFSIVSLSRTTILPMILILVINILFMLACKKNIRVNKKQIVCIVVSVIIGLAGTFLLYAKVSYLMQEKTAWGNLSSQIVKALHLNENESAMTNSEKLFENFQRKSMKGLDGSERFTSGRTEIWKDYIKELNWLGHNKEERHIVTKYYDYTTNAHNTYLQIAYSTGIQGGIAFLVFIIMISIYSLLSLIRAFKLRVFDIEMLSTIGVIIAFGLNSLVAVGYSPFSATVVFVFWVVCVVFVRKDVNLYKKSRGN